MCAFDLFLKSELSNCIPFLLISVYLFYLLFGDVCGLHSYLPL